MQQDDASRLRRMSEELGDDRLINKPVVVLDDVFSSPDSNISPEKVRANPLLSVSASSFLEATGQLKLSASKAAAAAASGGSTLVHNPSETQGSHAAKNLLNSLTSVKKDPLDSAAVAAASKIHPNVATAVKSEPLTDGHNNSSRRDNTATSDKLLKDYKRSNSGGGGGGDLSGSKGIKLEPGSKAVSASAHVKRERNDSASGSPSKAAKRAPGKDRPNKEGGSTSSSSSSRGAGKTDVSELLKTIGRKKEKEDFYRVGPPRSAVKKEATDGSDVTDGQAACAAAAAGFASGEGKDGTPLVRNKSTISLSAYRDRRPPTPQEKAQCTSGGGGGGMVIVDPSLQELAAAMGRPDNAAAANAYPLLSCEVSKDEAIKASDRLMLSTDQALITSVLASPPYKDSTAARSSTVASAKVAAAHDSSSKSVAAAGGGELQNPPRNVRHEKAKLLQQKSVEHLPPDAKTLIEAKQDKLKKLTARIEAPPVLTSSALLQGDGRAPGASAPSLGAPSAQQPPVYSQLNKSEVTMPALVKPRPVVATGLSSTVVEAEVEAEPGEIVDDPPEVQTQPLTSGTSGDASAAGKEKLGIKIKLSGQPVVVASAGGGDVTSHSSSHGHRDKHKHKHKSKHKRDREKGERSDRSGKHERDGDNHRSSKSSSGGAAAASAGAPGSDLKVTLNLKQLGSRGSSPHVGGNSGDASATPAATVGSAAAIPPMKIVLSKDKSGQYSSGHSSKHKHTSSRKRTHSPVDTSSSGSKVARSGSPGPLQGGASSSGGANGSNRSSSPAKGAAARIDRLHKSQHKMIDKKIKDKSSSSSSSSSRSKNNKSRDDKSPARLPAGYQNPNSRL